MIFRVEVSEDDKLRLCALNGIDETKLSSAGREFWRKAGENRQIRWVKAKASKHPKYLHLDLSRDDLRTLVHDADTNDTESFASERESWQRLSRPRPP